MATKKKKLDDSTLASIVNVEIPPIESARFRVRVIGTSVLVLNEMWRDVFSDNPNPTEDQVKLPRDVEALAAALVDVDGHTCINASAFKGAMVDAMGHVRGVTKKGTSQLFKVIGNTNRLGRDPLSDVRVYGVPMPRFDVGNLPQNKGKCPMRRTQIMPWAAEFDLEFFVGFITEAQLGNLVNLGGTLVGVGDMRTGARVARNLHGGGFRIAASVEFNRFVKDHESIRIVGPRAHRRIEGIKPSKVARATEVAAK